MFSARSRIAPGVEPVFPEKRQAINYAETRACFRSGEIRILDSSGNVERVIASPAPNFLYKNVSGQTPLAQAQHELPGWTLQHQPFERLVSPDHKSYFVPYDNGANSNSGASSPGGFAVSAAADY